MKRFEWSDVLSVGDAKIDAQHKDLIENVNGLLTACKYGEGLDKLPETFEFLESHVLEHFSDEEAFQEEMGCPDIENHRAEHERFLKVFEALVSELNEKGPSLALVIKTSGIMMSWLEEHLAGSDRELGRFIMMKR